MSILERLKEINTSKSLDLSDVGELVQVLPDLLKLIEAAKAYVEDDGMQTVHLYGELEAALAKLEGGDNA